MRLACILLLCLTRPLAAEVLVPLRTIRAQDVVRATDFRIDPGEVAGAHPVDLPVDGLEARVALYPGRIVRVRDLGPRAIIDRNDIVTLVYARGGLRIATEGRALGRGGAGDQVRVMNLGSRTTVTGIVLENGHVEVH
ncbi:MAG: flagellar basal body P-ring formation chaperone FlgA [Ruegeria sp.]